jgi:hypothetical protein
VNAALSKFVQEITSTVSTLDLTRSQETKVPVTVKNTGGEVISSVGKYPVTVSYKWFLNETMLPIEGERTLLPNPLQPGESTAVDLRVIAPPTPGRMVLRITLVQEGVQWFFSAGAKSLDIPVNVK